MSVDWHVFTLMGDLTTLGVDRYLVVVGLARGQRRVDALVDSDGWFVILNDSFGVRGCGFTLACFV